MFKMLIVEDEPATLEGIKSAVDWSLLDISICGGATNGLEAIELVDDLKPDIVLCDIRMPKMDGISFVNQIQPRHPKTKIIFLSGHSDKEYLKSAIRLNVVDYVYKPFELGELIQAIEKAKAACIKDYAINNIAIDDDIALNLLQTNWTPSSSLKDIPLELDNHMVTIVVRFNSDLQVTCVAETFAINHYYNDFRKVFSNIFDSKYVISCVNNGYVLHTNIDDTPTWEEKLASKLDQIFNIPNDPTKRLTIGIGNPVVSYKNLRSSFMQARVATDAAFLAGHGQPIFFDNLSTKQFIPSKNLEGMFSAQIHKNNIASATDFLEEYVDYMCSCRPEDIPAMKDELARIAFLLTQKFRKNDTMQQKYVTEAFNYALDIRDIEQYLLDLLGQIQDNINELDSKGRIIFDVETFILQNYNKDLTIDDIAENVYLTPTYLCHLYKKTTGRTLNQFILEVKMNKAKRMLTNTTLNIGEIASQLGYSNQGYFSKTFTKYFGMNPSTFRNKHL